MPRYRKVSTVIWNDRKFRSMSDKGQLVFLFLMTHPHMTSLGAMRATMEGLCKELGKWPIKAFTEAFREATAKGMAEYDEEASFIALPNFLKHNPPESPNVIKSWMKGWDDLPECELKCVLQKRVAVFTESLSRGFQKAFDSLPEGFRKGMPNQEQEQEQEQNSSCTEPDKPASEPPVFVLTFQTNGVGTKTWGLTQEKIDEYRESYPAVDILAECRKAAQWTRDNQRRRKTAGGMPSFLNRWLTKAQDGATGNGKPNEPPRDLYEPANDPEFQ